MSSIQDVSAEQLARLFVHYHEALAHDFSCSENGEASSAWEQTPDEQRKLMVAAARLALLELAADSTQDNARQKYFAKPGEADWGC
jgi:hypothetical protein